MLQTEAFARGDGHGGAHGDGFGGYSGGFGHSDGPAGTITFANDQTSERTPVRSDAIPSAVGELPSKSGTLQTYRNRARMIPKYLPIKPA